MSQLRRKPDYRGSETLANRVSESACSSACLGQHDALSKKKWSEAVEVAVCPVIAPPELYYSPDYRIGEAMQDTDVVHTVAVYMFVAYGRLAHPG